jgi:hypothetical protein
MESLPLIFLSEVKNGDSYGLWREIIKLRRRNP